MSNKHNLLPYQYDLPVKSSRNFEKEDCVIIISDSTAISPDVDEDINDAVEKIADVVGNGEGDICVLPLRRGHCRLIYCLIRLLNRDYDDIRIIYEAAHKSILKAVNVGSKNVFIIFNVPSFDHFGKTLPLVACLGALNPLYVPLLTRELSDGCKLKCESINFFAQSFKSSHTSMEEVLSLASKIDAARSLMRDIGGTDPERMSPVNIVTYIRELFVESPVKIIKVIENQSDLEINYPLFAAVNRGVAHIPKHSGRVVWLEYTGDGNIEQSLYLIGKGVVYDTGGHNLKVNGIMAGMHRDKCGAAVVAGFFKFLHDTRPPGLHVVGALGLVRNEIGPEAYVADEIITARSGVRVVVTNTDAEGRMAMADLLSEAKDLALARVGMDEKPPQLFTIATLTSHAFITFGEGYSVVVENGPARRLNIGEKLQQAGESLADMLEISSLRREDYENHRCKNEYADLLQTAANRPSSRIPRGHQCPAAFLVIASGLEAHGIDSDKPLAFTHLDICGGAGEWMSIDPPNPATLLALIGTYVLPKLPCSGLADA